MILRAVFGMAAGPQLDELRTTLKQLLDLGASPLTLLPLFRRNLGRLTTWQRFVEVRDRADALILALIEERRRAGEEGDDVMTMLLAARDEAGQPMTDRELRDELVTLLVAGHETTASALSLGLRAARARARRARARDATRRSPTTPPTSRRRSRRSSAAAPCCRSPSRGGSSSRSRSAATPTSPARR